MKRKILVLLASVALLVCATATGCFEGGEPESPLEFAANATGYTVTYCDSKAVSVEIPATYEGKPVNEIGERAFSTCSALTAITIPDSVVKIGDAAFYSGCAFSSVRIPDSVIEIGESAFGSIDTLEEVTIGKGIAALPESCFTHCEKLARVTFASGSTLSSIGNDAFGNCSALETIELPDSVTTIEDGAFRYSGLKAFTLPAGVNEVGNAAFGDCDALKRFEFLGEVGNFDTGMFSGTDSLEEWKGSAEALTTVFGWGTYGSLSPKKLEITGGEMENGAFQGKSLLTSVKVCGEVGVVSINAFRNCSALGEVTLESGITAIGSQAFSGCAALTEIRLPETVESVGANAFGSCTNLASFGETQPALKSVASDAFLGTAWYAAQPEGAVFFGSALIAWKGEIPKDLEIPAGTTCIANGVFDTKELTSLVLHEGLKYIGAEAFSENALIHLTLPESMVEIGESAFYKNNLNWVELGSGIRKIGEYAFDYNHNLHSVSGGENLESIGLRAFAYTEVASFVIPKSVLDVGSYIFGYGNTRIFCEAEQAPEGWDDQWAGTSTTVYWYREEQPQTAGNFWHYVGEGQDREPAPWA